MNAHFLTITFIAPTNFKPSRVKIASPRFNESVVIPYDHNYSGTFDIAMAWLANAGYSVICSGEGRNCYHVAVKEFVSPKEAKADHYATREWRLRQ